MDVRLSPVTQDNQPAVLRLQGAQPTTAEALAATTVTPGSEALAIVDAEHAPVGLLVHGLEGSSGRWWIRYLMIDQRWRRRGYARGALARLVERLAPLHHVTHLYARPDQMDPAARSCAGALGFAAAAERPDDPGSVALPLPPRHRMAPNITLRDVTLENARACIALAVTPDQAGFVASNAASLIQSKFEPHWLTRAIYDDETMVGFVMYGRDPDFGWGVLRLMVDAAFQGRGYGRAALRLVLEDIRAAGAPAVGVSYEDDNQVARRLYRSLGFVETGEQPFGEPFAVLTFPAPTA
jgi:RimJ/RimL family protein N-acetyltransferase